MNLLIPFHGQYEDICIFLLLFIITGSGSYLVFKRWQYYIKEE